MSVAIKIKSASDIWHQNGRNYKQIINIVIEFDEKEIFSYDLGEREISLIQKLNPNSRSRKITHKEFSLTLTTEISIDNHNKPTFSSSFSHPLFCFPCIRSHRAVINILNWD